jgi:hypothetical protein
MNKIALIGNTCNNNFSILRYFRDLGYEADLLLYSNEGYLDENPIHNPDWDTWEISKWEKFIHRLDVPNGIQTVVGRPDKFLLPSNLAKTQLILNSYDYFIGSGITPSLFYKLNRKLDIFYPYSTGIEWVSESENLNKLKRINLELPFRQFIKYTQLAGIKNSRNVFSHGAGLKGINSKIFNKNNINQTLIHTPQYYNREIYKKNPKSKFIDELTNSIEYSSVNIFSFMRQLWVYQENKYSIDTWKTLNKQNNWLILGFNNLINSSDNINAKLYLSSVGPDVAASKKLIEELNLTKFVCWLPLLARKEVSFILNNFADIAVGQFVSSPGETSGSTTWECVAAGIPFIDSFNFTNKEFQSEFGINKPPLILEAKSVADISNHLVDYCNNKQYYNARALNNKIWFNNYNGISLAKKWIEHLSIN